MSQFEHPLVDIHDNGSSTSIISRINKIETRLEKFEDSICCLKTCIGIWITISVLGGLINLWVIYFNK